jgi:hypothetical protein
MPFTSKPDAIASLVIAILVPVSMIKMHERCRNETGKLAS